MNEEVNLYTVFILTFEQKSRYFYFLFYKRAVYIIFQFCKCFNYWENIKFVFA